MNDALQELIGHWVSVLWGPSMRFFDTRSMEAGILESYDDAFLYLRKPDGEVLCLPMETVRRIERIEPFPPDPAGTLLRPAEKPSEVDRLLRPAKGGSEINLQRLLRPVGILKPKK